MVRPTKCTATAVAFCALIAPSLVLTACGGDEDTDEAARSAPEEASFPAPDGRTLEALAADSPPGDEVVVSPAGQTFAEGRNRFGFGVFTVDREQITDADVAIYAAPGASGKAQGPYPARVESLETEPAFTAQTTADDPDAARVVYASDIVFDEPGEWRLLALVRTADADEPVASVLPSVVIPEKDPVPAPGESAPRVHTPTADEVGDVQQIDTRVPPGSMHEHDLAQVLGKQPVVLLFATPALCASRVCGPVVDVAEQVKREYGDDAAFIHSEIYEDNDPNKGAREQVRAYDLKSEPWLFVINGEGRVDTRIEGAFSVAELTDAVERVTG